MKNKNKMNKALTILIIFTFTQYSLSQSFNYKQGDTLRIFALSGLKLRNEGNINSKVLSNIKFGEKVVIIDTFQFDSKKVQIIEEFSGQWVKVKYDTLEGYTFDGFLSSLPMPKTNLKKINSRMKADGAQNDYDETTRIEWTLTDYINAEFYTIGKPIKKDNKVDGEGLRIEKIQKISCGFTKIDINGWEWYGFKIEMPNIRLSEVKNLILVLVNNIGLKLDILEKIRTNVKKINENTKEEQTIFNIHDFNLILQKTKNNKGVIIWSLSFDRVVS